MLVLSEQYVLNRWFGNIIFHRMALQALFRLTLRFFPTRLYAATKNVTRDENANGVTRDTI